MPSKSEYQRWKAEGKCPNCGGQRDDDNYIKCSKCRHKNNLGIVGRAMQKMDPEDKSIAALMMKDREKALQVAAQIEMTKAIRKATTYDLIKDAVIASLADIDLGGYDDVEPYRAGPGKPETQVALLSDTHYGRVTPSFNTDVCRDRLRYYEKKIVRIADLHRNAYPIDELHIFSLGDIIDNEVLFPTQPHEIEIPVFRQISELAQITAQMLIRLSTKYETIRFTAIPGNHGRVSKYHSPVTNWDNLFYEMLHGMLNTHMRIHFNIPSTLYDWYKIVNIRGHGFLLVHGDQVQMWMNIPWYGLVQAGMRWQGSMPEPWQYMTHGHFHVSCKGSNWNDFEIISNGTLLSGDDYVLKKQKMKSDPTQITFGVNERHGMTWRYGIRLP